MPPPSPPLSSSPSPSAISFADRIVLIASFLVGGVLIFLRTPPAGFIASDADGGHQLAGAMMIRAGEVPFVDFVSTYGPAVFYASWAAQSLVGWRLVGEMLLCVLGWTLALTLVLHLARKLSGSLLPAIAVWLLAVIQLPRFYKYYIFLGPLLVLWAAYRYLESPTRRHAWLLAATVSLAGLFRPDMGAYSVATALLAAALAASGPTLTRLTAAGGMLLKIILTAFPWWGFLLYYAGPRGALTYLHQSTLGASNHAEGLSLPIPTFQPNLPWYTYPNLEALNYLLWFAVPALATAILYHRRALLSPLRRNLIIVSILLGTLCLLQSAHRAEYRHLIQAISVAYILLAFIAAELWHWRSGTAHSTARPILHLIPRTASLALVALATTLGAWAAWHVLPPLRPQALTDYTRYFVHPPDEMLRRLSADDTTRSAPGVLVATYARTHVPPGDRFLAIPFQTAAYYLSGRNFAGGQMLLAPGYFSTPADQQRMIDRMTAQGFPLVIEAPNDTGFDGKPERATRAFARDFCTFLDTHYDKSTPPELPPGYVLWRAKPTTPP